MLQFGPTHFRPVEVNHKYLAKQQRQLAESLLRKAEEAIALSEKHSALAAKEGQADG